MKKYGSCSSPEDKEKHRMNQKKVKNEKANWTKWENLKKEGERETFFCHSVLEEGKESHLPVHMPYPTLLSFSSLPAVVIIVEA